LARILVIEDEPGTRLLLETRIKDLGHDVVTCETGALGLARARDVSFDLFLVDVHLGVGIDGYEVCRRLRSMPQTATSPVVLVSGRVQRREELHLGYEAGCVAFLLKTDLSQLWNVLQAMLRLKSLQDDLAMQNRLLEERNRRLSDERQRGAELERALRDSDARSDVFRELASGRPDGMLIVDSEGVVTAADRGAQDVFGRELGGQHLADIAPRSGLEAFVRDAATEPREGLRFDLPSKPGRPSRSLTAAVSPFLPTTDSPDCDKRCVLIYDAGKRRIVSDLLRLQGSGPSRREHAVLVESARRMYTPAALIGGGRAMQALRREITAAIQHTTPVLLEGEPGTGREFAARAIHFASSCGGAFLTVECAALSPDSLEVELFGCVTDAVPGAYSDRAGLVHEAQFGTLFLAEIHTLLIEHQRSLLALIERGEVVRVGATKPEAIELRVMASTSVDLEREVRAGRFLPELHARLSAGLIRVPALRERREDLADWARMFAREHGARLGLGVLSPEVESLLTLHDWPQNLPELSEAILRALQACHGARERTVRVEHLPAALRERSGAQPRRGTLVPPQPLRPTPDGTHVAQASQYVGAGPWLVGVPGRDAAAEVPLSLREFERLCLVCALARTKGDRGKAATLLGLGKSTFYRRLAKHGL
jgi:DNA-binding NtrC family response regulator